MLGLETISITRKHKGLLEADDTCLNLELLKAKLRRKLHATLDEIIFSSISVVRAKFSFSMAQQISQVS